MIYIEKTKRIYTFDTRKLMKWLNSLEYTIDNCIAYPKGDKYEYVLSVSTEAIPSDVIVNICKIEKQSQPRLKSRLRNN